MGAAGGFNVFGLGNLPKRHQIMYSKFGSSLGLELCETRGGERGEKGILVTYSCFRCIYWSSYFCEGKGKLCKRHVGIVFEI